MQLSNSLLIFLCVVVGFILGGAFSDESIWAWEFISKCTKKFLSWFIPWVKKEEKKVVKSVRRKVKKSRKRAKRKKAK